jgi:hypothetical protein
MSVLPKIQQSHVIISEEIREFCDTVQLERFAIACTVLWRELFTRDSFLIGQSRNQGD